MSNYPETIYCGKNPVRTFTMNGITKFVARDICKLLGYPRADKMLAPFVRSAPEYIKAKTRGGTQAVRVIEREDLETVLSHSRQSFTGNTVRRWTKELSSRGRNDITPTRSRRSSLP